MLLPVDRSTVTVLGSVWGPKAPWAGLDFANARVRNQSTLMMMIAGKDAPYDHHLDVPFIHPDDGPLSEAECVYRVRPRMKPGKRWQGRKVRSVQFVRQDAGWALDVQFASDPVHQ